MESNSKFKQSKCNEGQVGQPRLQTQGEACDRKRCHLKSPSNKEGCVETQVVIVTPSFHLTFSHARNLIFNALYNSSTLFNLVKFEKSPLMPNCDGVKSSLFFVVPDLVHRSHFWCSLTAVFRDPTPTKN